MRIPPALALTTAALTALAASLPRALQEPAPDAEEHRTPVLVVRGTGEESADPDRALVRLGATVQAQSAQTAQREVSLIVQSAVTSIRESGVPEERLQTSGISLHPVYSDARPRPDGEERVPRIAAYRASNSLRVELDDPSAVGRVIDLGVAAGANEVGGISFGLADDTAQRTRALSRAVASAREKARALAEAAGVRLVAVQRLEEQGGDGGAPMRMRMAEASYDAGTTVQPGRVRVSASVVLTYRIAPRSEGAEPGEER